MADDFSSFEFRSFIRGYHNYKEIWTPTIGQVLVLRREPDNVVDRNAVAVVNDGDVVGHVPANLTVIISRFLSREMNNGFAEVVGDKVNRGAGYGLEIPCVLQILRQ